MNQKLQHHLNNLNQNIDQHFSGFDPSDLDKMKGYLKGMVEHASAWEWIKESDHDLVQHPAWERCLSMLSNAFETCKGKVKSNQYVSHHWNSELENKIMRWRQFSMSCGMDDNHIDLLFFMGFNEFLVTVSESDTESVIEQIVSSNRHHKTSVRLAQKEYHRQIFINGRIFGHYGYSIDSLPWLIEQTGDIHRRWGQFMEVALPDEELEVPQDPKKASLWLNVQTAQGALAVMGMNELSLKWGHEALADPSSMKRHEIERLEQALESRNTHSASYQKQKALFEHCLLNEHTAPKATADQQPLSKPQKQQGSFKEIGLESHQSANGTDLQEQPVQRLVKSPRRSI